MKTHRLNGVLFFSIPSLILSILSSPQLATAQKAQAYRIDIRKLGNPKPKTSKEKLAWDFCSAFRTHSENLSDLKITTINLIKREGSI